MPNLNNLKFPASQIPATALANTTLSSSNFTGSIPVSKLATTLNLSSNTVTLPSNALGASQASSGQVVGVWYAHSSTQTAIGTGVTNYTDLSGFSITFTTKRANSIFWLHGVTSWYQDGDTNGLNVRWVWNGSAIVQSNDYWQGGWHAWSSSFNPNSTNVSTGLTYSPSLAAGTSVTAKLQAGKWGGSNTIYCNYSGYGIFNGMTIMEIVP